MAWIPDRCADIPESDKCGEARPSHSIEAGADTPGRSYRTTGAKHSTCQLEFSVCVLYSVLISQRRDPCSYMVCLIPQRAPRSFDHFHTDVQRDLFYRNGGAERNGMVFSVVV